MSVRVQYSRSVLHRSSIAQCQYTPYLISLYSPYKLHIHCLKTLRLHLCTVLFIVLTPNRELTSAVYNATLYSKTPYHMVNMEVAMEYTGVMQEIGELLTQGNSSRQVIDMGYTPQGR